MHGAGRSGHLQGSQTVQLHGSGTHCAHSSHVSHGSHVSHVSHGSHVLHGSHGSHVLHVSHGSHVLHGSHGSHVSHVSHGLLEPLLSQRVSHPNLLHYFLFNCSVTFPKVSDAVSVALLTIAMPPSIIS